MTNGERRKESFDDVADAYNTYRPQPPAEVVDALVAGARLDRGCRVLEIACGTGQLSVPLAHRGVDLTAVELGPQLAMLAERNLQPFLNARVVVGPFEDWPLPEAPFDAVVCANAFHWLDEELRCAKSAAALRSGGFLAIVAVNHVAGGTPGFFDATQPVYAKWALSDGSVFQLPNPKDLPLKFRELEQRAEFEKPQRTSFEIPMQHTTASYVGWLRTDSLVNTLDDEERRGFLDDIGQLIESQYDGEVARNFVYDVITARRV